MRRRRFLQLCLAGAAGSRLAPAFSSAVEFRLKLGNSDTPIFPFRTGEHAWWGYIDAAGQILISADNSRIIARFSDFYGGLGAVRYDDGSAWMIDTKGSKRFPIYPGSGDWNYVLREGRPHAESRFELRPVGLCGLRRPMGDCAIFCFCISFLSRARRGSRWPTQGRDRS